MSPCPLSEARLSEMLIGEPSIGRVIVLDEVASTNDEIRRLAAGGAAAGTVVLAERQTAGRGRLGRRWHSPRSRGLYLSVLFRPGVPPSQFTRWTLAAAVAGCEACRQVGADTVVIKWPNDLLWQGRKLGGILTEMRHGATSASELVIGIGLNVEGAPESFPDELSSSATSLAQATGGEVPDRVTLAAIYLRELADMGRDLENGAWATVAQRWERLAPGAYGQRVRVVARSGSAGYRARTRGLDPSGALVVAREDGRIETVRSVESVQSLEEDSCC